MKIRKKTNKRIKVKKDQVIDRSAWVCGANNEVLGKTSMLNDEGNMCCLGHVFHNAGFGVDSLLGEGDPESVASCGVRSTVEPLVYKGFNTSFTETAIEINDADTISLKDREKQLKVLFKENGLNLTFKGRYPAAVLKINKEKFGE